ncbi:MAG: M15 family metallopeptidase [Rubrobacteraceae bacterium]
MSKGRKAVVVGFFFVLLPFFVGTAIAEQKKAAGNCEQPLVTVDKEHSLPPGYVPPDLAYLSHYDVPFTGWDKMLRKDAAEQLSRLTTDSGMEGVEILVSSAYRSYYEQAAAFAYYTYLYGTEANRVSAFPGHSEHQLGTTVDFTNAEAGYEVSQVFGETDAARWLQEHAADYGYVMSYPDGKEDETGYVWEPWHYRYVGVENAHKLEESDKSPPAFVLDRGVKPDCD